MRDAGREAGLTLIELLLALALLALVLLGIAPLFVASVKSNYSANEYTSIHVLARDRLEQLMSMPFDDPQLDPGMHGPDVPSVAGVTVNNPYRVSYEVFQYQIPAADIGSVPVNSAFNGTLITGAGQPYQYKRIDVTVTAGSGWLGVGL